MAYIILAAAGVFLTLLLIYRRRDPALLAVFFVAGAMIVVADYLVIGLFQFYWYMPGLVRDPLSDAALGIILGEMLFAASVPVICAVFLPPVVGTFLSTALLLGIETLFLKLNLYAHQGWTIWHSALLFPIYFAALRLYGIKAMREGVQQGWTRFIARGAIVTWWLHLLGVSMVWLFRPTVIPIDVLPTFAGNQALGWGLTGWAVDGPLIFWTVCGTGSQRLVRGAISAALLLAFDYLWDFTGLRVTDPVWWNPFLQMIAEVGLLTLACLTDRGLDRLRQWQELD